MPRQALRDDLFLITVARKPQALLAAPLICDHPRSTRLGYVNPD
jgi:hypothetical protein